jgi:transaldolase
MTNPLLQLEAMGQSVWLDNLNRQIIKDGELERLIDEDGLKGLTSNPSIFEKAIAEGEAYDGRIRALLAICDAEPPELYERLAVADPGRRRPVPAALRPPERPRRLCQP